MKSQPFPRLEMAVRYRFGAGYNIFGYDSKGFLAHLAAFSTTLECRRYLLARS
jgi:hypothetical protein